jgi:hypothetical protein
VASEHNPSSARLQGVTQERFRGFLWETDINILLKENRDSVMPITAQDRSRPA